MRVGVGEHLADLGRGFERRRVVDGTFAECLPEGPAGYVLVGDVDVARVACEGVCALAARMAEAGRGSRLALGP